ncbi:ANTAR domain-containing protein [Pseudonocardia sp. MCCB 268]|nr:ANTAR domain-containing protein [Pseudonocardia cytotoxica]
MSPHRGRGGHYNDLAAGTATAGRGSALACWQAGFAAVQCTADGLPRPGHRGDEPSFAHRPGRLHLTGADCPGAAHRRGHDRAAAPPRTRRPATLISQLHTAVSSRVVIEQANGMLVERFGLGPDQAFRLLRDSMPATTTGAHRARRCGGHRRDDLPRPDRGRPLIVTSPCGGAVGRPTPPRVSRAIAPGQWELLNIHIRRRPRPSRGK